MRYSIERIHLLQAIDLSFAKNMSKNIGKNVSKNLSGKQSQKLIHQAKKYTTDALKTKEQFKIQQKQLVV